MAWGSRSFNGSSDHITHTALIDSTNFSVSFSIFAWVFPTSFPASNTMIWSQGTIGGGGIFMFFGLDPAGTGKLNLEIDGANADLSSTALTLNAWNHVGFTNNNHSITFYINGSASGTTIRTPTYTAATARIGDGFLNGGSESFFFNGRIGELGIWGSQAGDGALSAAEAKGLSQGIRPPFIRSTNLYWHFPLDGLNSPEPIFGNLGITAHPKTGTVSGTSVAAGPPYSLLTPKINVFLAGAAQSQNVIPNLGDVFTNQFQYGIPT